MTTRLTRREWAMFAAASPAIAAQSTQPAPAFEGSELDRARQQLERSAAALDKFDLPMATEPACTFRA